LAEGDYVQVIPFQTSGAGLDIDVTNAGAEAGCWLTIERVR
jgi:hypothetical protein